MGLVKIGRAILDLEAVKLAVYEPASATAPTSSRLYILLESGPAATLGGDTAVAVWRRLCERIQGADGRADDPEEGAPLESSRAASLVRDLVKAGGRWTGTALQLMEELARMNPEAARGDGWPRTPRGMAAVIRTFQGALAREGVGVGFSKSHKDGRLIDLHPLS